MSSDYFVNHARASRFPWSIYHRPLERSLATFLAEVADAQATPRVLVVGAGYLHERSLMPSNVRLSAVDIDERVVEHLKGLGDRRIERCVAVKCDEDLRELGTFDAVYAKEVIEHVVEVEAYLRTMTGLLVPGGRAWFSTPNYGDPVLPFLERTVLEAIGRLSGYSRKDIHPTRFSADTLEGVLRGVGLAEVSVRKTPLRLALVGTGRKPLT